MLVDKWKVLADNWNVLADISIELYSANESRYSWPIDVILFEDRNDQILLYLLFICWSLYLDRRDEIMN